MKLHVENMTCDGCARSVTKAIQRVDPAAQVAVDLGTGAVEIRSQAAPATLAAALEKVGYPTTVGA